jgi:hypothetical protein
MPYGGGFKAFCLCVLCAFAVNSSFPGEGLPKVHLFGPTIASSAHNA